MQTLYDRLIIRIKGEDSFKFLQNLITNDLNFINEENIFYALIINPSGKYLSELYIYKINENEFLIDYPKESSLLKLLSMYKLKSKIDIIQENDFFVCFHNHKINSLYTRKDYRFDNEYSRSIVDQDLNNTTFDLYREQKYKHEVPDFYDLEENVSFVVDFSFDKYHAISYNKGCFLGQEILTRAKFQGVLRKKFIKGEISELTKAKGDGIFDQNNNKIGKVTSVYNNIYLGIIKSTDLT
jgi:folate-binding protein YgfZ